MSPYLTGENVISSDNSYVAQPFVSPPVPNVNQVNWPEINTSLQASHFVFSPFPNSNTNVNSPSVVINNNNSYNITIADPSRSNPVTSCNQGKWDKVNTYFAYWKLGLNTLNIPECKKVEGIYNEMIRQLPVPLDEYSGWRKSRVMPKIAKANISMHIRPGAIPAVEELYNFIHEMPKKLSHLNYPTIEQFFTHLLLSKPEQDFDLYATKIIAKKPELVKKKKSIVTFLTKVQDKVLPDMKGERIQLQIVEDYIYQVLADEIVKLGLRDNR